MMKRAASSDLAADDMTNMMIWEIVMSGPLLDGMRTSSERKVWDPVRLRTLLSLSQDASECHTRKILWER